MRVVLDDSTLSKMDAIPDTSAPTPSQPQQNTQDFVHPTMMKQNSPQSGIGKFAATSLKAISEAGQGQQNVILGASKGFYDIGKSIADLIPGVNLPKIDEYSRIHGDKDLGREEYGGGYVGSQLFGDTEAYKLAFKIPGLAEKGISRAIARGAISQAATGEQNPGGRKFSALVGGLTAPLGEYLAMKSAAEKAEFIDKQKGVQSAQQELEEASAKHAQGLEDIQNLNTQASGLSDKINAANEAVQQSQNYLDKSEDVVDSLRGRGNGSSARQLRDAIKENFDREQGVSKNLYEPINNSDIDLSKISRPENYQRYKAAVDNIKKNADESSALFGKDSDIGKSAANEAKVGGDFFGNSSKSTLELPTNLQNAPSGNVPASMSAVLNHVRNLQRLGETAISSGRRREGSLLFDAASGLKTDLKDILRSNGYGQEADQLEIADLHHQQKVLPHYKDPTLNQAIRGKKIPTVGKMSNALFNENNSSVLDDLPDEAKNNALYGYLTKGSKGEISAKQLYNRYMSSANIQEKTAQFNPEADNYLSSLRQMISRNKEAQSTAKALSKGYTNINRQIVSQTRGLPNVAKSQQKVEKAISGLEQYKQNRLLSKHGKIARTIKNKAVPVALGAIGVKAYSKYKNSGDYNQ